MTDHERNERRPTPLLLAVTAFVVGMGVMMIEITASRILAPYYGASLFVWTSIIVTVLFALSVGYWLGGNIAEHAANARTLAYMLLSAAALLLAGVWAVEALTNVIADFFLDGANAMPFLFLGSLLASFIVFASPVFLLAMSGPVILKSWAAGGGDIGRVSGRYFATSTIGSVVGTLAPSLFAVPMFGAKATMTGVAAIFIMMAVALYSDARKAVVAGLLVLPLSSFVAPPQTYTSRTIAAVESPYQLIRVEEEPSGRRLLIFNEGSGVQSMWHPEEDRTFLYYDHLAGLTHLRPVEGPRRTLMLGLAAGTGMRQYLAGAAGMEVVAEGVEVDPAVVDLARRYFALDDIPVDVRTQDGRVFLARSEGTWHDIIVDAYSTQLYIAPHLATEEFFALVASRLEEGGVLAININATKPDSRLLRALLNTIASQFEHVYYHPAGSWNYMVVASNEAPDLAGPAAGLPPRYVDVGEAFAAASRHRFDPDGEVFTDDRAPIEVLTDGMILQAAMGMMRGERP